MFAADELGGGVEVLVREPREVVERRARILRRCALLARAWLEGYERKMPPLERRTHRDLDAQAEHAWRVSRAVGSIIVRAVALGPMRAWGEAVDAVAAMAYDDVVAELLAAP